MNKEEFTTRTNEILKERGITQKELSKMSNITEASLSRYLSGDYVPRIDVVRNIAIALGVSVSYLIGESEGTNNNISAFNETYNVVARNKSSLTDDEKAELIKLLFKGGKSDFKKWRI